MGATSGIPAIVNGIIQTINAPAGQTLALNAGTGNQNVTLVPSGTGIVSLGTTTTNTNVLSTTSSTSPTTGALTVAGGLGIGGSVYIGSTLFIGSQYSLSVITPVTAITGNKTITTAGLFNNQLSIYDNTGNTIGAGGAVSFEGNSSGGVMTTYAAVGGSKENATATDYAGALAFYSRVGGGNLSEKGRFSSNGNLLIGGTTDIPGSGGLKVFSSTVSTSTTTGALTVAGGLGVAGSTFLASLGVVGNLGVFNTTPIAQKVGYGTPTGGTQTINFPGATATLVQTSGQLAQLMLDLKAYGIIGA